MPSETPDFAHLQQSARDHLWMHFTRLSSYQTGEVPVIVRGDGVYIYDARGKPVQPNGPGQVGWTLNAAWADYNTTIRMRGFSSDGLTQDGGCCVVNCNNVNQMYSFHTSGVNTLRGDYFNADLNIDIDLSVIVNNLLLAQPPPGAPPPRDAPLLPFPELPAPKLPELPGIPPPPPGGLLDPILGGR